jgi:hypothetical protein
MPIKDLSETERLPRLGKIHLGTKHPEKGYPMKADHFIFPKDHSSYDLLVKTFGEEPKELRVLIPVEDEEQWATQYYKAYNITRGLVCKGDGETAMRQVDVKTGDLPGKDTATVTMKEMPCAGRKCPDYMAKKCKETMNLRFVLPEIPGLGVWQIDTGSINSILNINSSGRLIKRTFGRVSMIPLILSFKPAKAKNPQDGKQQTIYVLNLETTITLAQLADVAREQAKTLMLTAPDLETAYELETEQLTDDLFGEAPSKPTVPPVVAEAVAPPVNPQPEATTAALGTWYVDQEQLRGGLTLLNWTDCMKWLKGRYNVSGRKVSDVVPLLTEAQQKEFMAEVVARVEAGRK